MTVFVNVEDFENEARNKLPKMVYDYYASGAEDEGSLRQNRTSFNDLTLVPSCLVDVSAQDISTTILGCRIHVPVFIAPCAMHCLCHPLGEKAMAKAAEAARTVMVLSTLSTTSLEDVAAAAPNAMLWFQLYVFRERKISEWIVKRAEAAGYKALVVTVDTPYLGRRENDIRNKFFLPEPHTLANFQHLPQAVMQANVHSSGLMSFVADQFDPSITWDDIAWLKSITRLPLVLKGILRADDAVLAANAGVAAIIVSNHGARQLDGAPATIDVLPEIAAAVRGTGLEVYLDGGIRRGTDVVKALCLGAKAVLIGRPVLWALAANGEEGVRSCLALLKEELRLSMALIGARSLDDLTPRRVRHRSTLARL